MYDIDLIIPFFLTFCTHLIIISSLYYEINEYFIEKLLLIKIFKLFSIHYIVIVMMKKKWNFST